MAKVIPDLTEQQLDELPSSAEAKVYRALRERLSGDYVVFFQIGWVLQRQDEHARDGEADFVICHPSSGYLCVEVKGGGISFEAATGDWYSIDRHQQKHKITNPVTQAMRAKYSIRSKLAESQRWRDLGIKNVIRGHAVFFPDIGDTRPMTRADLPVKLIGCMSDLQNPSPWIENAFAYWHNQDKTQTRLGPRGLEIFQEVFARSFEVRPLISALLQEQEQRRLRLTKNQLRVLDFLRSHRRAAVCGGAGTGKTVLAVEKARRLSAEGFRTLLTCYNRQLADHLALVCRGTPNLEVMSFHQLCHRFVEQANKLSGRDLVGEAKLTYPGKDLYDVQLPNALAYSLEVLPDRFDAIVCDEGQDFREEYWVPLELMLADYQGSPLYIFFDDNQNLYSRAQTFPIHDEPYLLTTNCRNTDQIHAAAYRYYRGAQVDPPDNPGADIQTIEARGREQQAERLHSQIVGLISREGIAPEDMVVLIADARHKSDYYALLRRLPLPRPAIWLEEGPRGGSTVLLDTVPRFKGLESPVVFLWGIDSDTSQKQELLYVGISRAKSLLFLVGNTEACSSLRG